MNAVDSTPAHTKLFDAFLNSDDHFNFHSFHKFMYSSHLNSIQTSNFYWTVSNDCIRPKESASFQSIKLDELDFRTPNC